MAKPKTDKSEQGKCSKCGGEMGSFKKALGRKHKTGSSPDLLVHLETLSTLCPGTPRSRVLCEYYYESPEQLQEARGVGRKAKSVKAAAKKRAKQERSKEE